VSEALQTAKAVVRSFYDALGRCGADDCASVLARYCAHDLLWRGFHPFDEIVGAEQVGEEFWAPLKRSLRPMQHRMDVFFAGENEIDGFSSVWVASMGHLMGLFDAPWLGLPPTGRIAMLRYGAFHKIVDGQIGETAMFFDVPHLMVQAGVDPFPPQTGVHLVQPGPIDNDGLLFAEHDPDEGRKTLAAINSMAEDLSTWSGGRNEPLEDELRRSWHEDMLWWGPHGIGATYTIERYAKQHSGPFRKAFGARTFNGHVCRMAEGRLGGFFGWPNLTLENKGGFMGMPATGRTGDMRVIDFYSRRGDKLFENWIFIDLLHFWNQQGLDVLSRLDETGRV